MSLFVINQTSKLASTVLLASKNDGIVLIENAVNAIVESNFENTDFKLYALKNDLESRGLISNINNLKNKVNAISMSEFVALSLEYDKVVSV